MFRRLDRFWQIPAVYCLVLTLIAAATPLAFAPYYHFWLMPLLFAALIRLTELKPAWRVRSAYWFGWVGYTAQFWWIHTALHDVSGLPERFALPLTLLLPAVLAVYPAAAFWLYGRYTRLPRPLAVGVALPLCWTLTEFARERFFTGFGWGALGYSQIADGSPLAGFAPLSGIHLVTLATACAGAWLVLLADNDSLRQRLGAAAALLVLCVSGSLLRLAAFTEPDGSTVSVALVQGNIPQQLKFDPEMLPETYRRYHELVSGSRAQIVLLPETALPQFLQDTDSGILAAFAQAARQNGSALAAGIPAFTADGSGYLNAVADLTGYRAGQPEMPPLYAKNHLVPFGEYKPLPVLTNPLYRMMNMPLADFQRGGNAQAPLAMAGQRVAFNICYEDGFGDELIESAKQASLLANSSNMAWYGDSNAMWQQLQQSQTRALELGRYLIRATNNGVSAIVSPQGRVLDAAPINTVAVLHGSVSGMRGQTPYMKLGGSLPLMGVIAAALVWLQRRRAVQAA